jgi:LTXXQ motif family protein
MHIRLRPARSRSVGACVVTCAALLAIAPAAAQDPAPSANSRAGGAIAATILGPAMLPVVAAQLACGPGPSGVARLGADRIQEALSLTQAQAAKFDELKAASQKVVQNIAETCSTDLPRTPTGRVDALEHRLETMLAAVRTVKPVLDDFYGSLSDEQKARLNALEETNAGADAGARSADNAGNEEAGSPHRHSHHAHFHGRRHFVFRLPFPL